jgi:NADPH2:quinone reductase
VEALEQAAADITAALRDGALTPLPVHRFRLDDIGAAHEAAESGVTGKVIVEPGPAESQ